MEDIKFSIIIPAYNVEQYLMQCVESVLSQTYDNYEIILVDDGSTDSTPQICDEYGKNEKVKVIHKKNGGLSDARNVGFNEATGLYVLFLDSDDYWDEKDFLNELNNIIKKQKPEIIVFGMKKLIEDSNIIISKERTIGDKNLLEELIRNNHFKASACDKVIKRSILSDNKVSFPIGLKSEDIQWTFDVLRLCNNFYFYNHNVYVYRQRNSSITKNVREQNILDMITMFDYCINNANTDKKEILLSYVAYEYCVALGLISCSKNNISKKTKNEIYKRKFLLKYDISKKVKFSKVVSCICGIRLTSQLMGIFINNKRRKK